MKRRGRKWAREGWCEGVRGGGGGVRMGREGAKGGQDGGKRERECTISKTTHLLQKFFMVGVCVKHTLRLLIHVVIIFLCCP